MRLPILSATLLALLAVPALMLAQSDTPDTADPDAPQEEAPLDQAAPADGMTFDRMFTILLGLDPDARQAANGMELTIADIPVIVIADARADRMRAMVPIRGAAGLDPEELMRLMQANFDTALDARYAVANGRLWGTFIHPLSRLDRPQLLSGIAQTVNLARTYGTLYSGGAGAFGGGDSRELYDELLQELLDKGQDI